MSGHRCLRLLLLGGCSIGAEGGGSSVEMRRRDGEKVEGCTQGTIDSIQSVGRPAGDGLQSCSAHRHRPFPLTDGGAWYAITIRASCFTSRLRRPTDHLGWEPNGRPVVAEMHISFAEIYLCGLPVQRSGHPKALPSRVLVMMPTIANQENFR